MAFSAVVGTVATAAAPQTLGASFVVGGIVLAADGLLGGNVGDVSERAYGFVNENSTELGNRSPTAFPY